MGWLGYLGLAMVVLGIAVLTGIFPMTIYGEVLDVEPPIIEDYYPDGTQDSPTYIYAGRDLVVWARVVDVVYDGFSYFYSADTVASVKVTLEWGTTKRTYELHYYSGEGRWRRTIPASDLPQPGTTIRFVFVACDIYGNCNDRSPVVAYGKVVSQEIGGVGYLCPGMVDSYTASGCTAFTEESSEPIYLRSSTFTVFFVADPGAVDLISGVEAVLYRLGTEYRWATMSRVDTGVWRAYFENVVDGRYELKIYVVDRSGARTPVLSVWVPVNYRNVTEVLMEMGISPNRLAVGGVLIAAGIGLMVYERRRSV